MADTKKNTTKRWKMNDEDMLVEDIPAGSLPLFANVPDRRDWQATEEW